jgi:hypothetical protein
VLRVCLSCGLWLARLSVRSCVWVVFWVRIFFCALALPFEAAALLSRMCVMCVYMLACVSVLRVCLSCCLWLAQLPVRSCVWVVFWVRILFCSLALPAQVCLKFRVASVRYACR